MQKRIRNGKFSSILTLVSFVLIFSLNAFAQVRQMRVEGEVFQLPELGAILNGDGETIKFLMVLGAETRPKGYADVDVKENDELLMLNGNRIKSINALKELYEGLAAGDELKLGLRRDKQMFIAAFPKIDPENAPRMVVRTMEAGSDGSSSEIFPVPELQIMLAGEGDKVKVQSLPIDADSQIEGFDVQEGDIVTSLNGKPVISVKDFEIRYGSIQVGETIKMEVQRAGKTIVSTFAKPQAMGQVKIRQR